MNGDRLGFSHTGIKEILKTEFLVPEDVLEQKTIEQMSAALVVYDGLEDFLEKSGWERDNPEYSSEKYLTENRICRWVDGVFLYFSRLIFEEMVIGK